MERRRQRRAVVFSYNSTCVLGLDVDSPCHVPRFRRPSVIGTQMVAPMSEVLVCDTLQCATRSERTSDVVISIRLNAQYNEPLRRTHESLHFQIPQTCKEAAALANRPEGRARPRRGSPQSTYSGPSSVCLQLRLSGTIVSRAMSMSTIHIG